ncbi:MAG: AI-2E family transporter [Deltaproteobacteria bacterium]|nr:AI-2E family transporter [Deltaproteobacteria bacterium]
MKVHQIVITIAAFVVVVAGMQAAKAILVPFLLAVFIAIVSAPPMFWMQQKGLPRWLGLLIVVLGILSVGLVVAGLVGTSIRDFSQDIPVYESKLEHQRVAIIAWLENLGVNTSKLALKEIFNPAAAIKLVGTVLNGLGNALTNSFLILMTVIFMLLEASSFPAKFDAISGNPQTSQAHLDKFITNVKHYMAIKTCTSFATGILAAIWLTILGVDYPLLWGLLAFALNYVPSIGSIIAAIPPVLLAIVQLGLGKAMGTAAGYLVINLVMGNLIEPRFMGRGLGLSTLVVFLSLLFWGWILGPVGMLLSVPLTMTAKIALDSREETRWIAVMLGPQVVKQLKTEPPGNSSET